MVQDVKIVNLYFTLVRICPDLSILVQTCSDLLLVQTCPGLPRLVKTCPDLSRLAQIESLQAHEKGPAT